MSKLLDEGEQVKSKTRIAKAELTIILNQKKTEADNLVRLEGKAKGYGKRTHGFYLAMHLFLWCG
jgi:hypothetical protein